MNNEELGLIGAQLTLVGDLISVISLPKDTSFLEILGNLVIVWADVILLEGANEGSDELSKVGNLLSAVGYILLADK